MVDFRVFRDQYRACWLGKPLTLMSDGRSMKCQITGNQCNSRDCPEWDVDEERRKYEGAKNGLQDSGVQG
jgi:hypothetical protein